MRQPGWITCVLSFERFDIQPGTSTTRRGPEFTSEVVFGLHKWGLGQCAGVGR